MTRKTPLTLATVLSFSGLVHGRAPIAPPPREKTPDLTDITFYYTSPAAEAEPVPLALEMAAKDGKVEVRWQAKGVSHAVTCSNVVVKNGVLSITATERGMMRVSVKDETKDVASVKAGGRLDVSLADGSMIWHHSP